MFAKIGIQMIGDRRAIDLLVSDGFKRVKAASFIKYIKTKNGDS